MKIDSLLILIRCHPQADVIRLYQIHLFITLALAIATAAFALPAYAQETGPGGPGLSAASVSVRPVLVGVEFEGNEELDDALIAAQLMTRATSKPVIKSIFEVWVRLFEINPLVPERDRYRMRNIVDSLTGEIRYLNVTQAAADTATIRLLYNDFGFHDAAVDYRIRLDTARNVAIVVYSIKEGERYPIRGMHYFGLDEVPEDIRNGFDEPEEFDFGDDYTREKILAEANHVVGVLRDNGYAYAQTESFSVIQVRRPHPGAPYDSILVSIIPGNRYRFGETLYRPDTVTGYPPVDEVAARRQIVYKEGEWYSHTKVEQSIANLYALETFELARVDTVASLSNDSVLVMQIATRLRPAQSLQVAPDISLEQRGTENAWYLGASGSYTHGNLFAGGQKLTGAAHARFRLSDLLGDNQFGGSISYYDPAFAKSSVISFLGSLAGNYAVEDRAAARNDAEEYVNLRSTRWTGTLEFRYRLPKHTLISYATLRGSFQWLGFGNVAQYIDRKAQIRISEDSLAGIVDASCISSTTYQGIARRMRETIYRNQVLQGDSAELAEELRISPEDFDDLKYNTLVTIEATGDHRDDFFSPMNGYFANFKVEPGMSGLFKFPFLKVEGDARLYVPMWERSSAAMRLHSGVIAAGSNPTIVPITSRFTAGGANSNRGWGPREMLATIRPKLSRNEECVEPIVNELFKEGRRLSGGLALFEMSAELRWRPFTLPGTSGLSSQLNSILIIPFVDWGSALYSDYALDPINIIENLGLATGFSIGYDTPIGPLRFGLGIPIYDPINYQYDPDPNDPESTVDQRWLFVNRPFRVSDFAWHLTIGHAF